jgi:hypothetical protein
MMGPCAYAIFMLYCPVCRVRALDLSRSSAAGACADAHRSLHKLWLCVQKTVICWLVHRLHSMLRQVVDLGKMHLCYASLMV